MTEGRNSSSASGAAAPSHAGPSRGAATRGRGAAPRASEYPFERRPGEGSPINTSPGGEGGPVDDANRAPRSRPRNQRRPAPPAREDRDARQAPHQLWRTRRAGSLRRCLSRADLNRVDPAEKLVVEEEERAGPEQTRSSTHMATRSMPTVSKRPVAIATVILVPTPSVLDTSTGLRYPPGSSKSPPNPPMPPTTPSMSLVDSDQVSHSFNGRVGRVDVHPGRCVCEGRAAHARSAPEVSQRLWSALRPGRWA